jgi:hypothetical protein
MLGEEGEMSPENRPDNINISGISVSGVGGLGLVAVAALMTWVFPQAWWLVVFGAIGGVLFGVAIVAYRRYHTAPGPSGDDPTILFRAEAPAPSGDRHRPVPRRDVAELTS